MKVVRWNMKAREYVRSLDSRLKLEIGTLLTWLQQGERLSLPQSRPMSSVHAKAHELRLKDRHGLYRVIYVLCDDDEILVPHAFTKKTQKTPEHEVKLSKSRLKDMINENK